VLVPGDGVARTPVEPPAAMPARPKRLRRSPAKAAKPAGESAWRVYRLLEGKPPRLQRMARLLVEALLEEEKPRRSRRAGRTVLR